MTNFKPEHARVYRNLNNGLWSIQQRRANPKTGRIDWQVIGHAKQVRIYNVTVQQSAAGRDRARRDGVRNVHCSAQGLLHDVEGFTPLKGRALVTNHIAEFAEFEPCLAHNRITYNPFKHSTLVYAVGESEYAGSNYAHFDHDQKMYVAN